MRLSVVKSKNATSYYIIKSLTINGTRSSKVVKKLGTQKELEEKLGDIDILQWAKEEVEKLNRQELANRVEIIAKFSNSKLIPLDQQVSYNGGYLFLQSLYYELGLDRICRSISRRHRFKFDLCSILRNLIYTRILYPSSKNSSYESSKRFIEQPNFDLQHIYRALEIFSKENDFIQSELYKASKKASNRNTDILFYDCTNYFFEIEEPSEDKQFGISKENRPNPIVQMGLFMDADGLPLAFSLNPGNTNEQTTLIPLESKLLKDFEMSKFIVCTDAGLSSINNRQFNTYGERNYVTTQSLKKLKKYLLDWALSPNGWKLKGSAKEYNLNKIDDTTDNKNTYYKSRMVKENGLEEQLIVTYSPKYKHYLKSIREKHIARAESKIKKPSSLKKKRNTDPSRFIKSIHCTDDGEVAEKNVNILDNEVIAKEERFDGFYGITTSLDSDPCEIIKINKGRWEIEQSFRVLKSEFRARPVYLSRKDRIQAHFITCFIALLIYRLLEKRLNKILPENKVSGSSIIKILKNMNFMEIPGEGYVPTYTRTEQTDALHKLFDFRTDTEIVSKKDIKKIINKTKD